MSEPDPHEQDAVEPRLSRLAAASLLLACLFPPLVLVALVLLGGSAHETAGGAVYIAAAVDGLLAILLAVAALVQMRVRPGKYTGAWFAAGALVLTVLPFLLLVVVPLLLRVRQ